MNIEDFPMLKEDLVYLDNGATSLKPQCVIDKMTEYYEKYSANAHRGDYDISFKVDQEYEKTREEVRRFINARFKEEIVFTSGATESLNWIATYFFGKYLEAGDEVLITNSEHASNVLPWFRLSNKLGIVIKFIPLDDNHYVTVENIEKMLSPKT